MEHGDKRVANLWLADELWQLGAIQAGDFSLGTAVHSPVYVNLRLLISNPAALREAAEVMLEEVRTLQSMRHPRLAHYDLIAGVPFGGLHLATAFSLLSGTPLIYLHPAKDGGGHVIEGTYSGGQTVLIIDDLITGGRSILQTAARLAAEDLIVEDALVLLDRQQGGQMRLKREGINLEAILTLEAVLRYLGTSNKISPEWYHQCLEYLGKPHDTL
jgi:orotate phosphoribosyltransferase